MLGSRSQPHERRNGRVNGALQPGNHRAQARPAADRLQGCPAASPCCTETPRGDRSRRPPNESPPPCPSDPASCGNTSQISMPGTLVAIGLNSPRISAGASVLISHMSWCGGPPPRKILITALWDDARARACLGTEQIGQRQRHQAAHRQPADANEIASAHSHRRNERSLSRPENRQHQSPSRKLSSFKPSRLACIAIV